MANTIASSASGAVYLILLQLGSRLVTFSLNQILLRLASPKVFGTAAIQLEFVLNTILFLSREGVRGAMLRQKFPDAPQDRNKLYNTSWIPFFVGLPLSLSCCSLYLRLADRSVSTQPHFQTVVALYGIAAIIELASEPLFLLSQLRLDFRKRVAVEGIAVVTRSLVTLLSIWYGGEERVLIAFAMGQLAYASTLVIRYVASKPKDQPWLMHSLVISKK